MIFRTFSRFFRAFSIFVKLDLDYFVNFSFSTCDFCRRFVSTFYKISLGCSFSCFNLRLLSQVGFHFFLISTFLCFNLREKSQVGFHFFLKSPGGPEILEKIVFRSNKSYGAKKSTLRLLSQVFFLFLGFSQGGKLQK